MTSLTNEQIVAELKWTEKAIFDTIGVTPIYWRPPFGKSSVCLGTFTVVLFC
jgi:peptidoglycan/xylan/chitin deacetylase (PgdA/CDA1 family)